MDVLHKVPPEVSNHIFSFLKAHNLGMCLMVSKHWRDRANDNSLWKGICKRHAIIDSEEHQEGHCPDLCHWGRVWRTWRLTNIFRWWTNSYCSNELKDVDFECTASHGSNIAIFSKDLNVLHIYTVLGDEKKLTLIDTVHLYFPCGNNGFVTMDAEHIAVTKFNVILIFKKLGDTYELFRAYALVLGDILSTDSEFYGFVNNNINYRTTIELEIISGNMLWFSDFLNLFYVVNMATQVVKNIYAFETAIQMNDVFLTYSNDSVRVYDIEGNVKVDLGNYDDIEDISANTKVLSLIRGSVYQMSIIEIIDLETSELLYLKEYPVCTWIKVHNTEEILFTLEVSRTENLYCLSSLSARTGDKLWCYDTNYNGYATFLEVRTICASYVIVWPITGNDQRFYFIDSRTGKCIYEELKPKGLVKTVSDQYFITWSSEDKTLHVYSYF